MSTVPLQQDSRFDVLINCFKVQMASLISISHFSFFSFCHSWKTAICCLYFTLRFSLTRLTRLKTFIRWQVNLKKKEVYFIKLSLISYYVLDIKTYIHVIYITTIPRFHKSHFLKIIFWKKRQNSFKKKRKKRTKNFKVKSRYTSALPSVFTSTSINISLLFRIICLSTYEISYVIILQYHFIWIRF